MRLTAENLVREISNLPRDREYNYIHSKTPTRVVICNVHLPEGPIEFKRYTPGQKKTLENARVESISVQMIWRLANSIMPGKPVNVDRIFTGSYNSRSVLETLVAHTPLFHWCKPGRIEQLNTLTSVRPGHKHLIYLPNEPHENAQLAFKDVDMQISEIVVDAVYEETITLDVQDPDRTVDIEQDRRHARIQIALIKIGQQLGFRTWVASNDRHVKYGEKRLAEMDAVIDKLQTEQVLQAYPNAAKAADLIDCIWFKNGRLMPAVMEVEHSTGVTSGLTRMKGFYDIAPAIRDIRWTIVAPDELRTKVITQANLPQFREMDTRFFPYSAVDELYSLCHRRKPEGVTDKFLDCFMEKCVVP